MAQFWPLERAMFEVGPFLPFDNGPNGINTLVHPAWISSRGLAVVAAEDTPYLHVGLNAPTGTGSREWAVGVQNAFQPVLPKQDDGQGDGLLRLQRRTSYRDERMRHPLAQFGGDPIERLFAAAQISSAVEIRDLSENVAHLVSGIPLIGDILSGTSQFPQGKVSKAMVFERVQEALEQGIRESASQVDRVAADVEQRVRDTLGAIEELLDVALYQNPEPLQPFNNGRTDLEVLGHMVTQRLQLALRSRLPAARAPWEAGAEADDTAQGYLTLRVCLAAYADVRAAAQALLATLPKPLQCPPRALWQQPIWTTWARFKASVDQERCEQFAREIVDRGYDHGVMEIDDQWQQAYGDTHFDPVKFPDAVGMVLRLHAMGFKVTVWVMPFLEEKSAAFEDARQQGFLIRAKATAISEPALIQTWLKPKVAVLDVTNPAAVQWFINRLRCLQMDVGLDGFKFDAGEPCFLPFGCHTYRPLRHPAEFTHLYITRICKTFPLAEVRSGFLTQQVPLFTRMGDKFSSFGVDNGLGSLIPTLLTSGVLGYPFVLPDMVGGNAYFLDMPTKELVVRWTQANALMPAIQFSIAPWDLRGGAWWFARFLDALLHPFRDYEAESEETNQCVQSALQLRAHFAQHIAELMEKAATSSEPVCRPLWWGSPDDPCTFTINDQFMLGDTLLVAPQVVEGARTRDIYLPAGLWRRVDMAWGHAEGQGGGGELHAESGPQWLRGVPTELGTLPVFQLAT